MASDYYQVHEGDWTIVPKRGYRNQCCACGLVHVIDHRIDKDGQQQVRYRVDRRATAAVRRAFKFEKEGK